MKSNTNLKASSMSALLNQKKINKNLTLTVSELVSSLTFSLLLTELKSSLSSRHRQGDRAVVI